MIVIAINTRAGTVDVKLPATILHNKEQSKTAEMIAVGVDLRINPIPIAMKPSPAAETAIIAVVLITFVMNRNENFSPFYRIRKEKNDPLSRIFLNNKSRIHHSGHHAKNGHIQNTE